MSPLPKGLIFPLGVAVAILGVSVAHRALAAEPVSFYDLIASLDKAEPLDRASVERLIGATLECTNADPAGRIDCGGRFDIGGVKVDKVHFRWGPDLSFLNLDEFSGECVDVRELDKRLGEGFSRSDCTDGVVCIDRTYSRPWETISVGLGKDFANKCANSIALY
jgi:hypothetical protein